MDGWLAARVVRKHTMHCLNRENLAEHTWGVVHVLFCVWPNVPGKLILAAQYHDIGEYRTGDVPAHIKWAHPQVRETCESLEQQGAEECLPEELHHCLHLVTAEKVLVEICDKAELCFSTYYECRMGNSLVLDVFLRAQERIDYLFDTHGFEISEMSTTAHDGIQSLITEIQKLRTKIQ